MKFKLLEYKINETNGTNKMKFKLVDNINNGLKNESAMGVLNEELGVRFYLGQNGSKIGGLFTATGKLLKQLWDEDDEHYDDINYYLGLLEDLFDVPDLDYKNNNYNFAFKKSFITDEVREIIDNLNFYLNEIDYEVIEETIDVPNIEYQDNNQFAYKPLEEEMLNEATLTSIVNTIVANLRAVGITPHYLDNDKKFLLCTTPRGNTFCIPIEEQSRVNSTDYKKLRYAGNGIIRNGEVYDISGTHIGRAYYGVTTNHQHLDYDPNVYQYRRNNTLSGTPINFTTFINDIKAGKY